MTEESPGTDGLESQIDSEVADWAGEHEAQGGTSGFFAAVSRYYAQFLDTDFKKSRLPKRRLENKDRKGRRVGTPLKRYPGFEGRVWNSLQSGIGGGYTYTVPKGTYTASLPSTTLSAVRGQINALSQDDFEKPFYNHSSMEICLGTGLNRCSDRRASIRSVEGDFATSGSSKCCSQLLNGRHLRKTSRSTLAATQLHQFRELP